MNSSIYSFILRSKKQKRKLFAILIDPDKFYSSELIEIAEKSKVDLILIGGSLITNGNFEDCVKMVKKSTSIPVMIFPGNSLQISKEADGILFLSLISGRNPDLLIGKHVIAAPILKKSKLQIIPTGYMLIEGQKTTAALYMSNTYPIPADKNDIAVCTAIAGEMLGLKLIYLDAGSGAKIGVSESMINEVSKNLDIPLIIGGGIKSAKSAVAACKAGADIIVVGNAIEKNKKLISEISTAIHKI